MPNFDQLTMSTQRLLLRPLYTSDAQALFDIHSKEEVMRYWSSVPWASIDVAHERIARDLKAMPAGEFLNLGIVRIEDDALLGTCCLFHFDEQCRRAEIGCVLCLDAWGNGYMQEALAALISYGFSTLNLNRIEADIDPLNIASAKILLQQGFVKEGFLRERWIVNGVKSDTEIFGLLASDWQTMHST